MRPSVLLLSLLCILALTACGREEELTPPAFSNIRVNDAAVTTTPFKDPNVTITGSIDDLAATMVANSTTTGEVPVAVSGSDGSWSFPLALNAGANIVSFTASDVRGNINQMILTVHYEPIPRVVSVTQNVDLSPQLIVTFDEALLESSLATAPFAVDSILISGATLDTLLTQKTVTLPLAAALTPGAHQLTCPGVTDLAGNSIAADYTFTFTIAE